MSSLPSSKTQIGPHKDRCTSTQTHNSPTPTPSLTSTVQCCSQHALQKECWQGSASRESLRTICRHTPHWRDWGAWNTNTWIMTIPSNTNCAGELEVHYVLKCKLQVFPVWRMNGDVKICVFQVDRCEKHCPGAPSVSEQVQEQPSINKVNSTIH